MRYKKFTLKNGLRIIVAPMKDTKTATVLALVKAGSRYENKKNNGISHFLEHMCFKGTGKRPRPLDISAALDGVGGEYNAFTGQEYTGFFAKVASRHQNLVLDVISDIYLNSKLDPAEIEKEKGVIVEEINLYLDQPMRHVAELFNELLYGDQPAGWSIAGRKENILKIRREDFLNYIAERYVSRNTLVVMAGAVNISEAREKIERYFKNIKTGNHKSASPVSESQKKPVALVHFKKTDQSHLSLGVRAFDYFDERKYALEIMSVILGGGLSSRLFDVLRNQMGAAYYVRTGSHLASDCGYLTTQAGVDNRRVPEALAAILKEYRRLKEENIPERELRKAKDHIRGGMVLNMETSDEMAVFLGGQEISLEKILTLKEIFRKIERVSAFGIRKLARDIFRPEKLNLALIGPFRDKSPFPKILNKAFS